MNQMLKAKTISYDLGNSNVLFQPKWRKVIYGEHTLKNLEVRESVWYDYVCYMCVDAEGPGSNPGWDIGMCFPQNLIMLRVYLSCL